jgi:hypothetical protein
MGWVVVTNFPLLPLLVVLSNAAQRCSQALSSMILKRGVIGSKDSGCGKGRVGRQIRAEDRRGAGDCYDALCIANVGTDDVNGVNARDQLPQYVQT